MEANQSTKRITEGTIFVSFVLMFKIPDRDCRAENELIGSMEIEHRPEATEQAN